MGDETVKLNEIKPVMQWMGLLEQGKCVENLMLLRRINRSSNSK